MFGQLKKVSYGKSLKFKFLLYKKIAYDMRVFHDFNPSSFGQVQGRRKENCKIRLWCKSFFYGETLEVLIDTRLLITEGCVMK